jgi:hypothetical protein
MKRRSWDRRAAYVRKYGEAGAPVILRLIATIARRART